VHNLLVTHTHTHTHTQSSLSIEAHMVLGSSNTWIMSSNSARGYVFAFLGVVLCR